MKGEKMLVRSQDKNCWVRLDNGRIGVTDGTNILFEIPNAVVCTLARYQSEEDAREAFNILITAKLEGVTLYEMPSQKEITKLRRRRA